MGQEQGNRGSETGDSKTVSVKCTLVLTYSESRKKSDAVANDRQIERARAAVSSGEVVGYKSVGWKELVEVSSEKDEYVAVSLKDELIKERRLRRALRPVSMPQLTNPNSRLP